VVEGGAMRSVFSAGLLDGFIERRFNPFHRYYGVSAGANNLATYIAGDLGKSLEIYTRLAIDKDFMNYIRYIKGGHLLDLDWLSDKIFTTNKINVAAICNQQKPLFIVVTNLRTGEAEYIQATTHNFKSLIKASASLPLLYRGFPMINGISVTDGGVADGIPIQKAIDHGATHVLVIRSRHKSYRKQDTIYHKYIRWKLRNHKNLIKTMKNRIQIFDKTIHLIENPPTNIKLLEICPPKDFFMTRFCKNINTLNQGYYLGKNLANSTIKQWNKLCE
jgi:predicted patatin/cPLA2 family phospholipase